MNRIGHFLRAKTQYNLHSPFVYRLYTEALFSRARGHGRSFSDVVWRLEHYYRLAHTELSSLNFQLSTPDGLFLVVDRPHRHEAEWQAVVGSPDWQVTLDLYRCGIAVASPRLTKQHFLLR